MTFYNELRAATRRFMERHAISREEMAKLLNVSIPSIRTWAFGKPGETTVINEVSMNNLVRILQENGFVKHSILGRNFGKRRP